MVSDGDDLPPPAPSKSRPSRITPKAEPYSLFATEERPKTIKKKPGSLDENPKPLARNNDTQKRKREAKDDNSGAGGIFNVQEKPPPIKRARKIAGGKPVPTGPEAVPSAPLRDSQVLKRSRPAAKKNANYSRRAKAARISSPARNTAALLDGDEFPDTLDLETGPVEPCVESPLMDDGDDDSDYALSPPAPKPKPKAKATSKRKPRLAEKPAPPENLKANAMNDKAKTHAGTRTRAMATRAKCADDEKVANKDSPQKTKAKAKRKLEVDSADKGEGGTPKVALTKDSPVLIEVSSSPLEPPELKHKPVSRVTFQEVLFQFSHSVHIVTLIRFISGTCEARTQNRQSDDSPSHTEDGYSAPGWWRFSR